MMQLVIIGVYLVLLLGLGLFSHRLFQGTSRDYLLASHSIGPVLLLMSLFGTTMTAFALVGSTGEAYTQGVGVYGMLASSSGIIHSLCFFLVGIKLWSLGRRYGYTTQVEYFRDRLGCDHFGLLLFPILVGLVIPYVLIGVNASGTVINSVTEGTFATAFAAYDYGVPNWLGSLVICAVVLVYVFYGGMRGTAWANTFQTAVFMILGIVTFFVIADKLGGLQAASHAVLEKHPSKLMREVAPEDYAAYRRALAAWEELAEYNWAVDHQGFQLTTAQRDDAHGSDPARDPGWQLRAEAAYAAREGLVQLTPAQRQQARLAQDDRLPPADGRLFEADDRPLPLEHFDRSETWGSKALALFADKIGNPSQPLDPADPSAGKKWTRKRALGVYRATHWAPEEPLPMSRWRFFTYMLVPFSVAMFPHLFQHWLTARSANAFKLSVVAYPIFIMIVWAPCILVGVWATSATLHGQTLIPPHFPANAVLAKMVSDLSTNVLAGLLTAGILAAIMSSLDSQFLCLGTMFTTDIVVHYGGKDRFSDRQKLLLARMFIVAIVAVTYVLSLAESRRVFQMGVWCFSGFSSLFPLVVAALYWRRLTVAGAYAGVLSAAALWGVLFYLSDFALHAEYEVLGIMPVALLMGSSALALVIVSLLTRPPDPERLARFFPPSGAG